MNLSSDKILPEDYFLAEEGSLLEEMAEEDEDIDLYNEVTFGLDQDSEDEVSKPVEPEKEKPEQRAEVKDEEVESSVRSPAKEQKEDKKYHIQEVKIVVESYKDAERSIEMDDNPDRSRMEDSDLGDPAVMKAYHGKPTLESVDSAVVDSGIGSTWCEFDTEYELTGMDSGLWEASPKGSAALANQILEDKAILRVMDKAPYLPPMNLDFLDSPIRGYMCSPRLKGPEMGVMSPKPYRQRFMRQQSPLAARPMRPSYPFTPPRRGHPTFTPNQSPGFMSQTPFRPMSPNVSTPSRPMTPKMVRMHFGPMSPSPSMSPFFSPMGNTLQRFKVPGHVTQLHPQHRRILNQRQRTQSSTRKQWDNRPDPYASLMSQKEKEWVIKLQMIQLQSENPHLDDYYYQTYYERLERRLAEEELLGERKKREPTKLVTPYIQKAETYESVVHIEGSLGQVAVSTCYSPRRAIDAVSFVTPDEDIKALGYQKLRVLRHVEKLFVMLLEIEEMERKMCHVSGEQHDRFQQKLDYKVQRLYGSLKVTACNHEAETENKFLQLLEVGKGKKLLVRLFPFLHSEQAGEVLLVVVHHLSFLIKNDAAEKSLPILYGPLTGIINRLTFTELIGVIQELTRPLPDTHEMPLTVAFQNQFGISLLYSLLSQGERLLSSDTPMEPCIGDFEKWTDTVFLVAKELSHVSKSSMVEPLFLPSNLLSLFCRYLDKQTIHKLEDKMECPTAPPYTSVPS